MPSRRTGKIRVAQRAALLLWITAQAISASALPGQHEDRYNIWKVAAAAASQDPSTDSEPAKAFDAATEPLNSTLFNAASPASPIELGFDTGAAYAPPAEQHDPLRVAEPPTWMSVGVAAALLAGASPRHHRRRTRTGHRHAAEHVA